MGKRHYELDTRVLTIFFFVAMPFVAFGSFLLVSMARSSLRETLGSSLEQRALETRFLLERYFADQIVHLRLLALDPAVKSALSVPPRELPPEELKRLEQAWAAGSDLKLLRSVLGSPLALRMRGVVQIRPALKLLQVFDGRGRLVAASARGGRLFLAEAPFFHALASDNSERPHIGDMFRPAGSAFPLIEIAYPVLSDDGGFLGGVRSLLDGTDLMAVLAPVRIGRTGHAVLVRATDGRILASDEPGKVLTHDYPGFEHIIAATKERRGFWAIPEIRLIVAGGEALIEPARIVGFSPVEQIPDVQWLVAVEQDQIEATAPVSQVTRFLWIHFIGAFGSVILLALYFSFKLEAPVIEDAFHLHEEHVSIRTQPPDEQAR